MSDITKRALEASLKKMLLKKPVTKITISDITEDCGVNRATFYYHFKDIYDLIEWSCEEDSRIAANGNTTYDTWEQGFLYIFQAVEENKPFILNVYRHVSQEQIMVSALCLAVKSGVDVRIITPHIYDKALIHLTTRSFYRELIYGGVNIYEYSKEFMHSKIFVSDDQIATVGTTNLDFRSLYLHFECGVWMYNSKAVLQIKKDYFDTLNECTQITLEECIERLPIRVFQEILRIFAPLM